MSKLSIAVVGAGIFGLLSAVRLAEEGHTVTVLDLNEAPMQGASLNNQNRLHLGFHYPRSPETAQQCIAGYGRFVSQFSECISADFQNCYGIASQGSLTTPEQYLAFCDAMKLEYQEIDPAQADIPMRNVDLAIVTQEAVYDASLVRQNVMTQFQRLNIELKSKTEVISAQRIDDTIHLMYGDGSSQSYDAVVNATYANQNRLDSSLGHSLPERQFEYTAIPVVEMSTKRAGVTIMDGGFMTILPFGKSNKGLLYHVDLSVVRREVGEFMPSTWLQRGQNPFTQVDTETQFEAFVEDCQEFIPSIADAECVDWLHGPRMVLANSDKNDERPSILRTLEPNYVSVFSGKTDHAPVTAEVIAEHFAKL